MLSRWYACDECRKSLSDIGWRENHIILYDRIALEKHIYTATRAERIQNSRNWILTANAEGGTHLRPNQRPDFAEARRECKRLHDENMARTQHEYKKNIFAVNKQDKEKGNNLKATKNTTTPLTRKQVGVSTDSRGETLPTSSSGLRANLQEASSSSSTWHTSTCTW